jgi:hypothetical protein
MTPQDELMILHSPVQKADPPPVIILVSGHDRSEDQMLHFCARMKQLVPNLKIKRDGDLAFPAPALVVGRHRNIGYQAAPTGKFLTCFMEALECAANVAPEADAQIDERLRKIDLPVILKLYVATQCPHCPQSIKQLQDLAAKSHLIRLRIIDAEMFSQAARTDQIRSVPTLVLDDQIRWTGPVNIQELLTLSAKRDPSQLSAASLRQLIEAGDAARVSAMMTQSGRLIPALIELLVHERWSVRLGAMVTAEYLAEESPALSLQLCESLWECFARLSPQIQGDVVQVLGQTKSDLTRRYLQSVISGGYGEEVGTAAAEVLEEMNQRVG